jgi:hypothetical protein
VLLVSSVRLVLVVLSLCVGKCVQLVRFDLPQHWHKFPRLSLGRHPRTNRLLHCAIGSLDSRGRFWPDRTRSHVRRDLACKSDPILADWLARISLTGVIQADPLARCNKSGSQIPSQLDVLLIFPPCMVSTCNQCTGLSPSASGNMNLTPSPRGLLRRGRPCCRSQSGVDNISESHSRREARAPTTA